jgi:large subunit ribosomal protein L3
MITALLGEKIKMSAFFDEKGNLIPLTLIQVGPCPVIQVKSFDKDGYWAVQIGLGKKKSKAMKKPILGHLKKAKLKTLPRFLREVEIDHETKVKVGDIIGVGDVFAEGDLVKITGVSKGKGFAGVMKRFGFSGGPATHGQTDRKRAPGSIGAEGVGRVLKGKKMPGRMGGERVTVSGLTVMQVNPENDLLVVKGAVPGPRGGLLVIKKMGKDKKFTPLVKEETKEEVQVQSAKLKAKK